MDQGSATETQDKEICRCISSWGKVRQLEMGGGGESLNLGFLCLYSEGRWETRWLHSVLCCAILFRVRTHILTPFPRSPPPFGYSATLNSVTKKST